jgi:hypothetical protein
LYPEPKCLRGIQRSLCYILLMAADYHCAVCEKTEASCQCDTKAYCALCYGEDDVRLCADGQYYCRTCREICDYQAQY